MQNGVVSTDFTNEHTLDALFSPVNYSQTLRDITQFVGEFFGTENYTNCSRKLFCGLQNELSISGRVSSGYISHHQRLRFGIFQRSRRFQQQSAAIFNRAEGLCVGLLPKHSNNTRTKYRRIILRCRCCRLNRRRKRGTSIPKAFNRNLQLEQRKSRQKNIRANNKRRRSRQLSLRKRIIKTVTTEVSTQTEADNNVSKSRITDYFTTSTKTMATSNDDAEIELEQMAGEIIDYGPTQQLVGLTTIETWVGRFKILPFKIRILHDILEYRTTAERNQYLQRILEVTRSTTLCLVADHPSNSTDVQNSHLHVIHDCKWSSHSCRCSFLVGLPIKQRTKKFRLFSIDADAVYWTNILIYLSKDGRKILLILINGRRLSIPDEITGK